MSTTILKYEVPETKVWLPDSGFNGHIVNIDLFKFKFWEKILPVVSIIKWLKRKPI